MKYTYEMHPTDKPLNATYTKEELEQLTTVQLREVCLKEKLVVGVAYKLDREYIINTILKYRCANLFKFVNTFEEDGYSKTLDVFNKYLEYVELDKTIFVPTKLILYKNTNVDFNDGYAVEGKNLQNGNLLLISDEKKICGILNIKSFGSKYYITCNNELLKKNLEKALYRNYYIGFLEDKGSQYLYNFYYKIGMLRPTKLKCILKPIRELLIRDLAENNNTLVIDFGTSNTSLGAYIDEHSAPNTIKEDLNTNGILFNQINKVKFLSSTDATEKFILPTVISVKECVNGEPTVYRVGYDALEEAKKHSYDNPQSIFYGIKKWINNYNHEEEVADENGNISVVPRKEMLRAYFMYIIKIAEQQHKCIYKKLHITSPVKQKVQFLQMYKEVLYDYEIEEASALDEGVAVLYNSISNQIEKNSFEENTDYNALIIDCGGGTTDLSSCIYYIEDNQITYKLNMVTTYANGETNFGGNNITYRIFQYLKIMFSFYYNKESSLKFEKQLNEDFLDTYRRVDDYGINEVYKNLESYYIRSEETIPTSFYYYKNSPSEDYMKVKSNFYFLWNLAEKIKIEFYETVGVMQTNFHLQGLKTNLKDVKIISSESWRLNVYCKQNENLNRIKQSIRKQNIERKLELKTDFPQVIVTKEDINNLIKGDIYYVIKKFLEPLYYEDKLNQFNFIKLTGQTCKIDIFRDALKEYIPGRIIQGSKKENTVQDYKLACLEGAIKYQNAKKIGLTAPTITNESPTTPYKLIAFSHTGAEIILMSSLEKINRTYGYISRNIDTESMELQLRAADNTILHKYFLDTKIQNFNETGYDESGEKYSDKILQDDIDNIMDNEIKIFSFAYDDKWGFYVLPLARKNKILYVGREKYLSFENDEWELNFFDGRK